MAEMQVVAWVTGAGAGEEDPRPPTTSKRHLRLPGATRTLCGTEIPSEDRVTLRVSVTAEPCKRCERASARRE